MNHECMTAFKHYRAAKKARNYATLLVYLVSLMIGSILRMIFGFGAIHILSMILIQGAIYVVVSIVLNSTLLKPYDTRKITFYGLSFPVISSCMLSMINDIYTIKYGRNYNILFATITGCVLLLAIYVYGKYKYELKTPIMPPKECKECHHEEVDKVFEDVFTQLNTMIDEMLDAILDEMDEKTHEINQTTEMLSSFDKKYFKEDKKDEN